MPYPWQILKAIHAACTEQRVNLPGSLLHNMRTNRAGSCVNFGGALLDAVSNGADLDGTYGGDQDPTPDTPEGTFIYYMVTTNDGRDNHCFCVYLWDNEAILIQVYLDTDVQLFRRFQRHEIRNGLAQLRRGNPVTAYKYLFDVDIQQCTINQIYSTRILGN